MKFQYTIKCEFFIVSVHSGVRTIRMCKPFVDLKLCLAKDNDSEKKKYKPFIVSTYYQLRTHNNRFVFYDVSVVQQEINFGSRESSNDK